MRNYKCPAGGKADVNNHMSSIQEQRKANYKAAPKYSYIIRVNNEMYQTTASPQLPVVMTKIQSQLSKLVKQGIISNEEYGTRIAQAEQVIADLKERNEQVKRDKAAKSFSKPPGTSKSKEEQAEWRRAYLKARREKKKAEKANARSI